VNIRNALTVDVEDYFQVSAFESRITRSEWDSLPSRIEANVDKVLMSFDAENVKGTFFVLGWISERFPQVVRRIIEQGHEIASHGCQHIRVRDQDRHEFRDDIVASKRQLEDVSGELVSGYRAPSFSIGLDTPWAHEELAAAGYKYSSSVFPIRHDHYGLPDAPRFPYAPDSGDVIEIPLSTVNFIGKNWPCAGGGYFRLLPLRYSKWAIRRLNEVEQKSAVFYFHPWELDPGQPKVTGIPFSSRFRHYLNLSQFERRLQAMLKGFCWDRMDRIFLGSK
jgi:polysaccharide deacetylase family protein (PEP-CTERM system associated)